MEVILTQVYAEKKKNEILIINGIKCMIISEG